MLAKGNLEVAVTLPSETEIRFTCFFHRPRQVLFEAWTRPEHIRHWWGCEGSTIPVCEVDLRVGGSWKVIMRMSDGSDYLFRGIYREIELGQKVVYSERYEAPQFGNPEWLATVSFEEGKDGTRITHTIRHASRQARDGHLQAGMEAGTIHSFHQIDLEVERMLAGATEI